jgi:hypothetical protein
MTDNDRYMNELMIIETGTHELLKSEGSDYQTMLVFGVCKPKHSFDRSTVLYF